VFPHAPPVSVTVFDPVSGRRVGRTTLPSGMPFAWPSAPLDPDVGQADILLARGFSYGGPGLPTPDFALVTVDTRTGRLMRTLPLGKSVGFPKVWARGGRVYLTLFGPGRAVSVRSGSGGFTAPSPFGPGRVRIQDARSGALLRAVSVAPGPADLAVDRRGDRLYVLSRGSVDPKTTLFGPCAVSVVDTRSGRVLRVVSVGVNAYGLTLDEAARRLLVLHERSFIPVAQPDSWGWLPRDLRRRLPFLPGAPPARQRPASLTIIDTQRL